jgi:undecaprenyl-diphosphatase
VERRTVLGRLHDLDVELFERVAAARLRGAHPVLPRLGRAADHGLLWLTCAAVLGLSANRSARRAALRGVGSLALASAVTNVAAKSLAGRRRPPADPVPHVRRLRRTPVTTSFPSGHSASAVAFATAAALESPQLGALLAPVAAGVAASRVYTGAHYPGDVLAGAALGAALAALTCRWWPLRSDRAAGPAVPDPTAPALPVGAGLIVVVNPHAGGALHVAERIRALLPGAGIRVCAPDGDLDGLLDQAAGEAAQQGGALGVAGGNGTVGAAAACAVRVGVPLAVFPCGTLNHFATDLGLVDLRATADAVEAGQAHAVDLGRVRSAAAKHYFLNTFVIGAYPELVRIRKPLEKTVGKWPALAAGMLLVAARGETFEVTIDGQRRRLWLLFVGNGRYEPRGFAPTYRSDLGDGLLDIRTVDGRHPFARTRLAAAFLTGTLSSSPVYRASTVRRLQLADVQGTAYFSLDGEVAHVAGALELDKARGTLTVYRPSVAPGQRVRE